MLEPSQCTTLDPDPFIPRPNLITDGLAQVAELHTMLKPVTGL